MKVEILYFEGCPSYAPPVDTVVPDVVAVCDRKEEEREGAGDE